MTKKLIAFDLDGTLAPSKSPLPDRMGELIPKLLDKFQVCVMSGGKFELFETQLISNLKAHHNQLNNLHLMPTCGTRYYRFNPKTEEWDIIYAEDFTSHEKAKIVSAIKKVVTELDAWEEKTWGETIEDRNSQISYSALGQDVVANLGEEGVKLKEAWDPDNKKKANIVEKLAPLLPEFEVRAGGLTTIDVTKQGIDKAYGMHKLLKRLGLKKEEALFMGDRLKEGGNDYPVKAMGVDCIEVIGWEQTADEIEKLLKGVQ
jgi:phosphomannomutase